MMKFAGKWAARLAPLLLLLCLTVETQARVVSSVDRSDIAMGETLRLTLTADEGEQPDEIDLTQLEQDFDILQRSSATSARIVGGQQSVTRTLELELAPRREGLLTIPALIYGGLRTTPIAVKVSPAADIDMGDALVLFDAEVSDTEVYVQAQILLTITLQQAINLDNRAISELEIPNTYVEALEQKSFQRRIAGRLWQVTELRYALFPQQSGTLEIPAIGFSGRELLPGRSLLGARLGKRIALQSKPIEVTVKPVPANFPGSVWLPARQVSLESRWSTSPERLAIGDSSTRTIEITAEGLQGSQLPPLTSLMASGAVQGLKFYPDQETVEQREIATGLEGYRLQSEALVATTGGSWSLPELVVPWWNTDTDSLEYARLPAVEVRIAAPQTRLDSSAGATASPLVNETSGTAGSLRLWQGISGVGWLLAACLGWLLWQRRGHLAPNPTERMNTPRISNRELVPLRLACSENNPRAARDALQAWGQAWLSSPERPTLDRIARAASIELAEEIARLEAALWRDADETWRGDGLFARVKAEGEQPSESQQSTLSLYPSG